MVTLKNDWISAVIKTQGAELCSLKRMSDGKEYIWQGDPAFWKRHAPVLFPVIGALSQARATKLMKHGFARDMTFECTIQSDTEVVMELRADAYTRSVYPYDFVLRICYTLTESALKVTYEVENRGEKDMPFSIGGHPALNCALDAGQVRLIFEKEEKLRTLELNLEKGLLSGHDHPVEMEGQTLKLYPKTFDIDTLIFEGLNSRTIRLEDPVTQTFLEVDFEGFPYLGIWSPKAPFVCIEPWFGLADTVGDAGKLEEKRGIEILPGGGAFTCTYTLRTL